MLDNIKRLLYNVIKVREARLQDSESRQRKTSFSGRYTAITLAAPEQGKEPASHRTKSKEVHTMQGLRIRTATGLEFEIQGVVTYAEAYDTYYCAGQSFPAEIVKEVYK